VAKINKNFRGFINIYKPRGPSSFYIIKKLRQVIDEKKIGHAGTLDPLASGVLLVAVGREYTKEIDKYKDLNKEYRATIKLGERSTTDDEEGEKEHIAIEKIPTDEEIKKCISKMTGHISQIPPDFSAKKIKGERAYRILRQGKKVTLKPNKVEIMNIDIINYKWPLLEVDIKCSKGTYIRSIARDLGNCLHTGGYIKSLERTAIGNFKIKDSLKIL